MTSAAISTHINDYTFERLSTSPPLEVDEAAALRAWWQRDAELAESFPAFLVRNKVLIADAVDTLRMMQKGYLIFNDNEHLFTKEGLETVQQLREISRSFSLDEQTDNQQSNAEHATQVFDLEPTELDISRVRPQREPSTVWRAAPDQGKSELLTWAKQTLEANWGKSGPLSHQVLGAYQVGSLLGNGPWGSVYHAIDLVQQREVALKVLDAKLSQRPEAETHFYNQSRCGMRLKNPNLVQVYSTSQEGEFFFQVMPYLRSQNLEQRLALEGALPLSEVWQFAQQACSVLTYLHQAGHAHHNLKPSNWWCNADKLLLSDYGLLPPENTKEISLENRVLVELRQLTLCMYLMTTAQVTNVQAFTLAQQTRYHNTGAIQGAGMDLSRVPTPLAEVIHRIWSIANANAAPTLARFAAELKERDAASAETLPQFNDDDCTVEESTMGVEFSSLSIGSWVGKCLITERIGSGSTCEVFRAVHRTLNVPVALKVLQTDLMDSDPSVVQTFSSEAKLLARLTHPNVVRVIDYEDQANPPYLMMEYVEGWSLAELIEQTGRLQLDRVFVILGQALNGLAAAAQIGLIHGDLNPANILLTKDGTAKIADFGLATLSQNSGPEDAANDLQVGAGTPAYMAPEQIEPNGKQIDFRADIYSLGCTFYHTITGRLPFEGGSPMEVWLKHLRSEVPQQPLADFPREVVKIINKMLAKAPEQRQQSYEELAADFNRCSQALGRPKQSLLRGWLKGKGL